MKPLILSWEEFAQEMCNRGIRDSNAEEHKDICMVSIHCTPDVASPDVREFFKEDHDNVLRLYFDDIEEEVREFRTFGHGESDPYKAYGITEEQAKKLYEFLEKHKERKECIVHCYAGISRSGAVGTFVHDSYSDETWEQFYSRNRHIHPNQRVLKLLRQNHNERQ